MTSKRKKRPDPASGKSLLILVGQGQRDFRRHLMRWTNCEDCQLHKTATMHVLGRGVIPCDILFVGEAPGSREDATGTPFIGRAGSILNAILDALLCPPTTSRRQALQFSYAISNVLACAPWLNFASRKIRPPIPEEEAACLPRLIEFYDLCNPKAVVLLGRVAERSTFAHYVHEDGDSSTDPLPICSVYHPAYILRVGGTGSVGFKRVVATLYNFLFPLVRRKKR